MLRIEAFAWATVNCTALLLVVSNSHLPKQPPEVFCRKKCSYNFANFTGKQLYRNLFLTKLQEEITLCQEIAKLLSTPIFKNICDRLLLYLATDSLAEIKTSKLSKKKEAVLKTFAIFTVKHLCWRFFLIKFQAFRLASSKTRTSTRDPDPETPRPWKTWTLINFDSKNMDPWFLDLEKHGSWWL